MERGLKRNSNALSFEGSSSLILAEALTPVHVGVGRAPGVVDLPVVRDSFGYPFIPASGIKGALKNFCVIKALNSNLSELSKIVRSDGRIKCSISEDERKKDENLADIVKKVRVCCCLFGSEPGDEERGAGLLSILDMFLLAIPAPSADKGYVYVTTPSLLMRAEMIADALGKKKPEKLRDAASNLKEHNLVVSTGNSEPIDVSGVKVTASKADISDELRNALASLGGLASTLQDRLYIINDDVGVHVVNKALLRVSRIRLMIGKKVVSEKALWTEEYVPSGAIFVGGIVKKPLNRNPYCDDDLCAASLDDILRTRLKLINGQGNDKDNVAFLTLGGKETIGKGILKLKML